MKEDKSLNEKESRPDVDTRQSEYHEIFEKEMQQISADVDELLSSLVDSSADPVIIGQTAITQKRVSAAFDKYQQRKSAIRQDEPEKTVFESKLETAAFVRSVKKDFVSRFLCIANLMDALQGELLILSKESAQIQSEKEEFFSQLKKDLPGGYLTEDTGKSLPGFIWLSRLYNSSKWRDLLYHIHLAVGELNDYWRALQ